MPELEGTTLLAVAACIAASVVAIVLAVRVAALGRSTGKMRAQLEELRKDSRGGRKQQEQREKALRQAGSELDRATRKLAQAEKRAGQGRGEHQAVAVRCIVVGEAGRQVLAEQPALVRCGIGDRRRHLRHVVGVVDGDGEGLVIAQRRDPVVGHPDDDVVARRRLEVEQRAVGHENLIADDLEPAAGGVDEANHRVVPGRLLVPRDDRRVASLDVVEDRYRREQSLDRFDQLRVGEHLLPEVDARASTRHLLEEQEHRLHRLPLQGGVEVAGESHDTQFPGLARGFPRRGL